MVALNASDIKYYKSSFSTSLGGAINLASEVATFTLHNLFPKTSKTEATTGITKFRCLYIKNTHTTEPIRNPILTIVQNTISPNDEASIGWDPSGINSNAQTITDENDYPDNVTFTASPDRANGSVLGQNIPPNSTKPFWIRIVTRFGAEPMLVNAFVIRLLADNLVTSVIDQAPTPSTQTSFTLCGESDINSILKDIIEMIMHRNANFHLSLGNNCLPSTSTNAFDWFNMLGPGITTITKMCLGAFDMTSLAQLNQYLNHYGSAKKYSAFTFQNIHFLMMDTASGPDSYSTSSTQYPFVVDDLKSASADSTIDWIFVIMNRAMYATQTTTSTKYVLKSLRDIYHPLFEKYGVHVVCNGYFRNYQRQHILQFNSSNSDNPNVILSSQIPQYLIELGKSTFDDGTGKTGCLFMNAGMAGAGHDNVTTPANSYTAFYNSSDYGYLFMNLNNNIKVYNTPGVPASGLAEEYHELILTFYEQMEERLIDQIKIKKVIFEA